MSEFSSSKQRCYQIPVGIGYADEKALCELLRQHDVHYWVNNMAVETVAGITRPVYTVAPDATSKDQCSVCERPYVNGKQDCTCNAGSLYPLPSKDVVDLLACARGQRLTNASFGWHHIKVLADEIERLTATLTILAKARWRGSQQATMQEVNRLASEALRGADETSEQLSQTFLLARLGTILNIAEGELTAKAQQDIARLAREVVRPTVTATVPPFAVGTHVRFTEPSFNHAEWVVYRLHDGWVHIHLADDRVYTHFAKPEQLCAVKATCSESVEGNS